LVSRNSAAAGWFAGKETNEKPFFLFEELRSAREKREQEKIFLQKTVVCVVLLFNKMCYFGILWSIFMETYIASGPEAVLLQNERFSSEKI
jgi:hypothetical protein